MEKISDFMHKFLDNNSEFTDEELELYKLALTHSTCNSPDNQRLAFLGDCILKHSIREYLYLKNPYDSKGILTMTSSSIESNYNYARIAIKLDIFNYIRIGGNPVFESTNTTVNAEAFEALFGAVYLTRGMEIVDILVKKYVFGVE